MTRDSPSRRRLPQQERSRLMVRRILDAARQVLAAEGYPTASTNKIAAAAGISPGSLYQYFPHKDAIVDAVVGDYIEDITQRATDHLVSRIGTCSEAELIRESLRVTLEGLEQHPALLRAIVENTPRVGVSQTLASFENRVGDLVPAHSRIRGTPESVPPVRIWLAVRAIEHLTIRYLLDRPPIERDQFLDEITDLVLRYAYRQADPEPPTAR